MLTVIERPGIGGGVTRRSLDNSARLRANAARNAAARGIDPAKTKDLAGVTVGSATREAAPPGSNLASGVGANDPAQPVAVDTAPDAPAGAMKLPTAGVVVAAVAVVVVVVLIARAV